MSIRSIRLSCAALTLTLLLLPAAGLRAADTPEEQEHDEDTPLHHNMEDMGRAMRVLNKALNSADPAVAKSDCLAAIQKMQVLAVEGKALTPASIAKLSDAERPAKLVAFRSDLAGAIETMLQIERAILADEWPRAKELFQHMRDQRKEGHEKYNPDEDEEKK
jgi:soluble cytochrome b562